MLRGVPVVGSRAGAIPEVLGDGAYGVLFEPGDEDGLVAAIARARTDGPELAARALGHAREAFSVNRMVMQTLAVYDGLERGEGSSCEAAPEGRRARRSLSTLSAAVEGANEADGPLSSL